MARFGHNRRISESAMSNLRDQRRAVAALAFSRLGQIRWSVAD